MPSQLFYITALIITIIVIIIIIIESRHGAYQANRFTNSTGFYIIIFFLFSFFLYSMVYFSQITWRSRFIIVISIFTATNIIAFILSYKFFNTYQCFYREGNGLARFFYYLMGEDLTHGLLLIARVVLNVHFIRNFLNSTAEEVLWIDTWALYPEYLTVCLITMVFTIELIANSYATTIKSEVCGDRSYLCKISAGYDILERVFCTLPAANEKKGSHMDIW